MATLTIPANYLDDARKAIIAQLRDDTDALGDGAEERESRARIMSRDMRVFERLLDATGDTTLEAAADSLSNPLGEMLDTMIRQLVGRLDELCVYGPLPVCEMRPLMDEMRWAADEAVRVSPDHLAVAR